MLCFKQLSVSGGITSSMCGHLQRKHSSVVEQPLVKDSTPVMTASWSSVHAETLADSRALLC